MARMWGTGTVYRHGDRWRARLPLALGRKSLGLYDSEEDARAALAHALELAARSPQERQTLADYGKQWLAERDVREGTRARDLARWRAYVADAPLGRLPLLDVEQHDVEAWLAKLRHLAPQTRQSALSLVRGVLRAAGKARQPRAGLPNPAADLRIERHTRARKARPWTWLRLEELDAYLACEQTPLASRLAVTVAVYTGLRAGELWGLRWSDVDWSRRVLTVSHSRGEATKSGEPRDVPLLSPAYEALRRWRALSSTVRSHLDLVFPAPDGGYHASGYDAGWSKHRKTAGITRRVRFHDLRHTCASHLVMGSWAPAYVERALRLEEVRDWLGHSDIQVTQRYAHLCPDGIAGLVVGAQRATERATTSSHLGDLNPGPTVYEGEGLPEMTRRILHDPALVASLVARLASEAARTADAIRRGDPHRDHRALDLVDAVLDLRDALEERESEVLEMPERARRW